MEGRKQVTLLRFVQLWFPYSWVGTRTEVVALNSYTLPRWSVGAKKLCCAVIDCHYAMLSLIAATNAVNK